MVDAEIPTNTNICSTLRHEKVMEENLNSYPSGSMLLNSCNDNEQLVVHPTTPNQPKKVSWDHDTYEHDTYSEDEYSYGPKQVLDTTEILDDRFSGSHILSLPLCSSSNHLRSIYKLSAFVLLCCLGYSTYALIRSRSLQNVIDADDPRQQSNKTSSSQHFILGPVDTCNNCQTEKYTYLPATIADKDANSLQCGLFSTAYQQSHAGQHA